VSFSGHAYSSYKWKESERSFLRKITEKKEEHHMKYVLMFCGRTPQEAARWEATSEEARAQRDARVGQWFAEYRSKIGGAVQLQAAYATTSVHFTTDGRPLITDGPFLEGTEVIGGYAEIDVADLDEALQMAKTWPAGGVEIRPVVSSDRS
jgi:hypothetical protein